MKALTFKEANGLNLDRYYMYSGVNLRSEDAKYFKEDIVIVPVIGGTYKGKPCLIEELDERTFCTWGHLVIDENAIINVDDSIAVIKSFLYEDEEIGYVKVDEKLLDSGCLAISISDYDSEEAFNEGDEEISSRYIFIRE